MADTNGPKIFVGPLVTPDKVLGWTNFQKFAFHEIRFLKILKLDENLLLLGLQCIQKNMKWKMGAKRPKSLLTCLSLVKHWMKSWKL